MWNLQCRTPRSKRSPAAAVALLVKTCATPASAVAAELTLKLSGTGVAGISPPTGGANVGRADLAPGTIR